MNTSASRGPGGPIPRDEVCRLLDRHFPGAQGEGRPIHIESVAPRTARLRLVPDQQSIRPGGTISGPAMFHLADLAIYVALIATQGETAIPAVTINLNINFLRRPEPVDLVAVATVIRLGRRLAYAEVHMMSEGGGDLVAHATGSYALTPAK